MNTPPTPSPPRTPSDAESLIDALIAAGAALRERGIDELLDRLGKVGSRFLDPGDPLAREALERIPAEAGLTAPMAAEVLKGVAREWKRDRLDTLVALDFPDRRVLDGFAEAPGGGQVRALGGRFALHIGSGNVPGVSATSLLLSLLVKCPLLLKPGRGDQALSELFLRGITEEDPELARAAAVVYWEGGSGGTLEEAALRRAERVVVYGGFDAIAQLRKRTPMTTPFVAYHHRVSMGAVAREVLDDAGGAKRAAREAARAVALYERRGCVSPQILWAEEGGRTSPRGWAELVAGELERLDSELPSLPLDPATLSEITHERGAAELRIAGGSGEVVFSGEGGRWTVFFEPGEAAGVERGPGGPRRKVCGGRAVQVRTIATRERIPDALHLYRDLLQTIALEAPEARREGLAEFFAMAGFSRITTHSDQPFPPAWWRHDGEGPLRALVRWVDMEV